MFNINLLEKDILNKIINNEDIIVKEDEINCYYITGIVAYIIPKELNYIQCIKDFNLDIINEYNSTDKIERTSIEKVLLSEDKKHKTNVRIYENIRTGEEIQINEKLLKYFDLDKMYFLGKSYISPIWGFDENDNLRFMVLPIRYDKNKGGE